MSARPRFIRKNSSSLYIPVHMITIEWELTERRVEGGHKARPYKTLEFGGIKIRIVHFFPYSNKLNSVFVSQPLLYQRRAIVDISNHVCKRNIVFCANDNNRYFRSLYINFRHIKLQKIIFDSCSKVTTCDLRTLSLIPNRPQPFANLRLQFP